MKRIVITLLVCAGMAVAKEPKHPTHNPFVKTGRAIEHALKAVGHGFVKMLEAIQFPTER